MTTTTLKSFVLCTVFVICILACIAESHAGEHPYPFHSRKYLPGWNPKSASCTAALRQSYTPCKPQLTDSYLSLHLSISSECCKAIQEIEEECGSLTSIIFPRFNSRLVYLLLRDYCDNNNEGCQPKVVVPGPVAPAPAPEPSDADSTSSPISPAPEPSVDELISPAPEQSVDEPISPAPEPSVDESISPAPEPSYIESPTPEPSGGDDDDESTSPVTEPIDEGTVVFPPVLVMPPDPDDYDPLVPSSPAFDYEPSPY